MSRTVLSRENIFIATPVGAWHRVCGMIPLEHLNASDLLPLVGDAFTAVDAAGSVALTLTAVTPAGPSRPGAAREPFALAFLGQPGLRLPQGIRPLTHAGLGTMEIFLTQVGDGADGSRFEAIFS